MSEKEPLKLTKKQLKEISQIAYNLNGLRQTQVDIAEKMGRLSQEIWSKIHKIFPELGDNRLTVDWDTGEVTQKEDC